MMISRTSIRNMFMKQFACVEMLGPVASILSISVKAVKLRGDWSS